MPKFYINEKGIVFKKIGTTHTIHAQYDDIEAKKVLRKYYSSHIEQIGANGETITIKYEDNTELTFNAKVFVNSNCKYPEYISLFHVMIKEYLEKEQIRKHRDTMPRKVNRNLNLGAVLVVSGAIVVSTVFYALSPTPAVVNNKETKKTDDKPMTDIEYNIETNTSKINEIVIADATVNIAPPEEETLHSSEAILANSYNIPERKCELAFDDKTGKFMENPEDSKLNKTGKFMENPEDSKLNKTINNCAPYLEPLIDRYGLPKNLTYALTSQEKGTLSMEVVDRTCGPMQIKLNAMHKEHFKVPIYHNGILTGEYDEFWAADAEKLDDPFFEGKKVLVIQNLEDNFQIGAAYLRRCIDRYKNIFIALDAYNKGIYAFSNVYEMDYVSPSYSREYYEENVNDFSWTGLINEHYKAKENNPEYEYGDPNYLWNVLQYLETDERGTANIEYYYKGEPIVVSLTNTNLVDKTLDNDYNISQARG